MFYRSAADQKLASLEARISRLENRMVRKAFESTIDAIYQKLDFFPRDLSYIASQELGMDYYTSGLENLKQRTKKAGTTLLFPSMTFVPGTPIQIARIDELDPNTIEITLIDENSMQHITFQETYSAYSDKHLRTLARLIVKNAKPMLYAVLK